nr:MAG TPA: hypothetical protein [Bacteriophage sp.]
MLPYKKWVNRKNLFLDLQIIGSSNMTLNVP